MTSKMNVSEYLQRFENARSTDDRTRIFTEFENACPSPSELIEFYNAWGKVYDVDMQNVKYVNPRLVAGEVSALHGNTKDISILDVGAGTGEGGKSLKSQGFVHIDALDASSGMLDLARKLGVHRQFFCELIQEKIHSVKDESYDVVMSSGSFYPRHLEGKHVPVLLNAVKKGGHLIISSCPHNDNDMNVGGEVQRLKEANMLRVIKQAYVPDWYNGDDGSVWVLQRL